MDRLDASTLRCPLPLVRVKLWLKAARTGQQLWLRLSDPGSRQDLPGYLERAGQGVEVVADHPDRLELIITKHP